MNFFYGGPLGWMLNYYTGSRVNKSNIKQCLHRGSFMVSFHLAWGDGRLCWQLMSLQTLARPVLAAELPPLPFFWRTSWYPPLFRPLIQCPALLRHAASGFLTHVALQMLIPPCLFPRTVVWDVTLPLRVSANVCLSFSVFCTILSTYRMVKICVGCKVHCTSLSSNL